MLLDPVYVKCPNGLTSRLKVVRLLGGRLDVFRRDWVWDSSGDNEIVLKLDYGYCYRTQCLKSLNCTLELGMPNYISIKPIQGKDVLATLGLESLSVMRIILFPRSFPWPALSVAFSKFVVLYLHLSKRGTKSPQTLTSTKKSPDCALESL